MRNKFILVTLGILVVMSLLLASCGTKTTTTAPTATATTPKPTTTATTPKPTTAAPTTSTPPTTAKPANWWDAYGTPQYGGTITIGVPALTLSTDNYGAFGGEWKTFLESAFVHDWKMDRKIWPFNMMFAPDSVYVPHLAKSWEMKDATTMVVKLREDVKWQNKAPVNGRGFTAYDSQYHYDRHLGTGEGFTKAGAFDSAITPYISKVTALDNYTLEYKFKSTSPLAFISAVQPQNVNLIEAPEVVKAGGMNDWKQAVGTGPWILQDYVADSSITYVKNPNYWGNDPRFPQNKVPYADTMIKSVIPDVATRLAAMRTGKIDVTYQIAWQQAQSLGKSNPELKQWGSPIAAPGLDLVTTKAPFSDINVRKAMDLALDRKAINAGVYGGTADGVPAGVAHPFTAQAGFGLPYSDWPQSLKDEYAFNPTKAKQLLTAAGLPTGFKTTMQVPTTADMALLQTIQALWKDVGIECEIQTVDPAAFTALQNAKKIDNMCYNAQGHMGSVANIQVLISLYKAGDTRNNGLVNDPKWEDLYAQFNAATNITQVKQILRQADQLALENHWSIGAFPYYGFDIWQPYLKGGTGEYQGTSGDFYGFYFKWYWIDQAAKKALGR